MAVYPAFALAIEGLFTFTYQHGPAWLNLLTEPMYQFLRTTVLPFEQKLFTLALPAAAMLLAVFSLELLRRRFLSQPLPPWRTARPRRTFCALANCQFDTGLPGLRPVRCSVPHQRHRRAKPSEFRALRTVPDHVCPLPQQNFAFGRTPSASPPQRASAGALVGTALPGSPRPSCLQCPFKRRPQPALIRPPGAWPKKSFSIVAYAVGMYAGVHWQRPAPGPCRGRRRRAVHPASDPASAIANTSVPSAARSTPPGLSKACRANGNKEVVIGRAFSTVTAVCPTPKSARIVCEEHCPTPEKAIRYARSRFSTTRGRPSP
ncbi:MAG: hypothetical protein R2864_09220 [Syntrophotaleaceae bacterium]